MIDNNINALAKMVVVEFSSIRLSELKKLNFDKISELYKNHSHEKEMSEYSFSFDSDEMRDFLLTNCDEFDVNSENLTNYSVKSKYITIINKNPSWASLYKSQYPDLSSFKITIPVEEYVELFYEYGKSIHMNIVDRIEIPYKQKVLSDTDNIENTMKLIQQSVTLFEKQMEGLKEISSHHYNLKCNSPLADNYLMSVNQTMLLEDCCSDYLQKHLLEGWRIISICNQPNQRRPDYILGKVIPADEVKSSALRGIY